ncbi:hypothetical protein N7517_009299 [Penicillium concentricum]|uniref:Uncharacterized protein n=1 Tax=Penicillium concentricum TaxID=293559 RepID=A0A9W9RGZ6_9EURO|nr:uncharacterized protein N7517_009299 [Penicillium concentricum]KAJ5360108.1 hypothetical protein N7517_009299 [Penicillium concentricum]
MEAKEQALRDHPDDDFKYGIGRFWKILPTRPYMNARLDYRAALTFVRHVESVHVQLDTLIEDLRLCRGDSIGSKDIDQECYDFLKWWATISNNPQYDWGDETLPYLDTKNANPLELIDPFLSETSSEPFFMFLHHKPHLAHTVALTLVKVKLYFILLATHGSNGAYEMATEKNRKIIDEMIELKNSTIAKNLHVANLTSLEAQPEIEKVKAQIRKFYEIVNKANPYFWPELIDPDNTLNSAPSFSAPGSRQEMQAAIMQTWQAWNETFGAIHIIHAIANGNEFSF